MGMISKFVMNLSDVFGGGIRINCFVNSLGFVFRFALFVVVYVEIRKRSV